MTDPKEQFLSDPIARHAIAELEARGFKVIGVTEDETIANLQRVLADNPSLDLSSRRLRH